MLDSKVLTFLEVAAQGSYTRAAENLHLTQPAVTQQIHRLEEHYGVKPILYVTYRSYDLYLREGYEDHPLWVSSPMVAPFGKDWSFWQYSHSAELEGYFGDERHIDLNVFRGSEEEFRRFGLA